MPKSKSDKGKSSSWWKGNRILQATGVFVLLGGLASAWFLMSGSPPVPQASYSSPITPVEPGQLRSTLRNRMVLPAQPRKPRPTTLDPASFDDPEVKASYQAAKDVPEELEKVACYCGCYASSGHRNNLDCFTDNHGVT